MFGRVDDVAVDAIRSASQPRYSQLRLHLHPNDQLAAAAAGSGG